MGLFLARRGEARKGGDFDRIGVGFGLSLCVDLHASALEKSGATARQMLAVTAWRESPSFTDAERAALALTEAVTRMADGDGVPDPVWDEAARHYDEKSSRRSCSTSG